MSDERDDSGRVREWRELYRRLTPPPLADGLDEAEAETARAVRWMQTAWRELEVPPAVPPMRRVAPVRARFARRALPWLVAAGVVAGGAALLLRVRQASPHEEHVSAAPITIEDVRADRLELRSGPVRLLLLSPPETGGAPSDPDSTGG